MEILTLTKFIFFENLGGDGQGTFFERTFELFFREFHFEKFCRVLRAYNCALNIVFVWLGLFNLRLLFSHESRLNPPMIWAKPLPKLINPDELTWLPPSKINSLKTTFLNNGIAPWFENAWLKFLNLETGYRACGALTDLFFFWSYQGVQLIRAHKALRGAHSHRSFRFVHWKSA